MVGMCRSRWTSYPIQGFHSKCKHESPIWSLVLVFHICWSSLNSICFNLLLFQRRRWLPCSSSRRRSSRSPLRPAPSSSLCSLPLRFHKLVLDLFIKVTDFYLQHWIVDFFLSIYLCVLLRVRFLIL